MATGQIVSNKVKVNSITTAIKQEISGNTVVVHVGGSVTRIAAYSRVTIGTITEKLPSDNVFAVMTSSGDNPLYCVGLLRPSGDIEITNRTSTPIDWLYGEFTYLV